MPSTQTSLRLSHESVTLASLSPNTSACPTLCPTPSLWHSHLQHRQTLRPTSKSTGEPRTPKQLFPPKSAPSCSVCIPFPHKQSTLHRRYEWLGKRCRPLRFRGVGLAPAYIMIQTHHYKCTRQLKHHQGDSIPSTESWKCWLMSQHSIQEPLRCRTLVSCILRIFLLDSNRYPLLII